MNHTPRYFLLLMLLLLGSFSLLAQNDIPGKLTWSDELKEPSGSYLSKIIKEDATGFYVLREQYGTSILNGNAKIFIEHYDSNMKFVKGEKYDLRHKKKEREFVDAIVIGGEIYILTSFHNQAHKINYLFAQKVTHKLRLSDKLTKIGEIPTKSFNKDGSFGHSISRDSSKLLVYNQLPYGRGEPERFAFHVYDSEFTELWTKDVELPYKDENFSVEEYQVDKDGNVYLLGVAYQDGVKIRRRGKPSYTYTILAYTNMGEDKREYRVNLNDKFVTDLTFSVANDGDLVCSGFYSEHGTFSIKGTYFFRINTKTEEVYNKNLKAFDIDFVTEMLPERRQEKIKKAAAAGKERRDSELYEYNLDELILRSDGGALLIAEQFFIERRENYNNNYYGARRFNTRSNNQFDYYYYYNDIIVVNIKPDGEIEWATRIPKRQRTINDNGYFSSYAHSIVRDKIYFVYNDNRRNFPPEGRRVYNFDGRHSIIALAEVSKDGSVRTFPLYNNRDADIITRPKVCKQTGKKEMKIYGEYGRNYRFANLKFQ